MVLGKDVFRAQTTEYVVPGDIHNYAAGSPKYLGTVAPVQKSSGPNVLTAGVDHDTKYRADIPTE